MPLHRPSLCCHQARPQCMVCIVDVKVQDDDLILWSHQWRGCSWICLAGFALLVIMSCWYTIFQTSPPFWADRVAAHTRIPSARSVSAALEVIGSISEHSSPSGNFPVLTSSEHCKKTLGPESSPPQNMRRPRIPKSHCVWFVVLRSSHMSTEKVSKQTNEYFN